MLLKSTLTPLSQSEAPNYTSIKLLQDELIGNTVSVFSPLEKGDTGHLFLVLSDSEYQAATISALEPTGLLRPTPLVAPIVPTIIAPLIIRSRAKSELSITYESYLPSYVESKKK